MTEEEKAAWRVEQAAVREKHRLERQADREKKRQEWLHFTAEERQFRKEENKRRSAVGRGNWDSRA